MANPNVPSKPILVSMEGGEVRISWAAPVRTGHAWNVYADIIGTPPLVNPALNAAPIGEMSFRFSLADVVGNSPPTHDLWVAITSVHGVTGQESAQGVPLAINVDSGDPAKPNHVTVGRAPSGSPTYLATDEDGQLQVGGSVLPVGAATEAKQDAEIVQLTAINAGTPTALGQAAMAASQPVVIASDQSIIPTQETPLVSSAQDTVSVGATSVALPAAPLANRRLVSLQNKGTSSVFINDGVADGASWEVFAKSSLVIEAGPGVALQGYRSVGTSDVLVWEFA